MTNESILISEVIPATPQRIFSAWMNSAEHSAFTGDEAIVVPQVGGEHRAGGGYIQGRTLELNEGARIVQSWRTTEFPPESPDSRVEITLEPTLGGTLVTLLHTDIPVGQGDRYRQGWNEYYLSRLKSYFADVDHPADADAGASMKSGGDDADLSLDIDIESELVDLDPTAVSEAPTKVVKAPKVSRNVARAKAAPKAAPVVAAPARAPAKAAAKAAAKPSVKLAASTPSKKAAKRKSKPVLKAAAKGSAKGKAERKVVRVARAARKAVAKAPVSKGRAKGRAKKVVKAAKVAPSRRAAKVKAKKRGGSSARSRY